MNKLFDQNYSEFGFVLVKFSLLISDELYVFAQLSDAQTLAHHLPGSKLYVIPNAGHLFNFETPEILHQLVLDFLGN